MLDPAGKLVERTIMRKYGVENATNNFISFNTICDATQVKSLLLHLFYYFPEKLSFDILVKSFLGLRELRKPSKNISFPYTNEDRIVIY